MLARTLPADAAVLVIGETPWKPPALPLRQDRAPPAWDLVLCGAGAFEPGLCSRVRPGGRLIAFEPHAPLPGAAAVDTLQVWDAPAPRLSFSRADPAAAAVR
jgi:hypothetical protein